MSDDATDADGLSIDPDGEAIEEPEHHWFDDIERGEVEGVESGEEAEQLGPEIPAPPAPGEAENPETITLFWRLVVVFNVALFCLAVGPMLVYFQGQWDLGSQLFLVGVVTAAYGLTRYVQHRRSGDDDDGIENEDERKR